MEKTSPLVSVIIPCYNHAQFLTETLQSVLNQSFSDWECILVDNSSTDNTKEIVAEFINKDKRFNYYFQENKGVSSARNLAIKNSSGKYILPLDSDDKIGPDYLKEAVEIFLGKPSLKVVYCEAELFGDAKGKWELPVFSMENMLKENSIFCSAFYRRSDYDKTVGYNEKMLIGFEDWDFWLELLKNGGEVFKIPKVHFYYRIRKSSRNNSLDADMQLSLRRQIYENHRGLYEKYLDVPQTLFDWYLKKSKLKSIESSRDFTIGKKILNPIRKLKSFFRSE